MIGTGPSSKKPMESLDEIYSGRLKRFFRATKKLNAPGLISHITQRSAGREPMFIEDDDYLYMIGLLKEVCEARALSVFAFCLMPNHQHILMSPQEENLYDAMRDLFSRYVMRFNLKYERKGHLVSGPYRQAVCFDDSYLLAASLYIHMNPVKAGLSENVGEYRWTSSRLYIAPDAPPSFIDPSFVLEILSKDKEIAINKYWMLLTNAGGLEADHVLEQEDAIERFRRSLAEAFPKLFRLISKRNLSAARAGMDLLSADALEEEIAAAQKASFYSTPESRKARRYLIEQMAARGFAKVEIANQLGISRKTLYNLLKSHG